MNFHDLGLHKALLRTLEQEGHTTPTPIQEQAIPVVIEGHDVVGLAQTGTGKTAAFLLPLIHKQDRPNHKGKFRPIRVLVLSPTRELAAQIYEKARLFGKSMNLRSQCTVGGVHISRQVHQLARGTDILIATPGRLLDLVKRDAIQLDKVAALVLDEADHMLDIGFLPDVKRIIAQLPKERQTLLFSATMPKAIQDLAAQYLREPVEISIARQSSVAENIDQSVKYVAGRQKPNELEKLLREAPDTKTVIFARTKHGADNIVRRLKTVDIEARAIHGNKTQGQRERALKAFTKGTYSVLVATDIAARGIDIKDVGLVVNYELPDVPEVYVHRIGRTARAGANGRAVAFCTQDETNKLKAIERLIRMKVPVDGEEPKEVGKGKEEPSKKPARRRNRPGSKARKKPGFKPRHKSEKDGKSVGAGDRSGKKTSGNKRQNRRNRSKARTKQKPEVRS
ncbi:MAG: DEAD/DEAH box helicase [Rhizobiaceae bacterium]|nr:DEAD/DEAH box helicase [Rhizobiaceae bacterium]